MPKVQKGVDTGAFAEDQIMKKRKSKKQLKMQRRRLFFFIILLLLFIVVLSSRLIKPPSALPEQENTTKENIAITNQTEGLFMDMSDNSTLKRYRASREIDANPMEKKFMGCFYNTSLIRDYSNQKYTLVYSDFKGTPAMNFTFSNMLTAEKTARESGICIYGQNYEFIKRQ